MQGPCTARTPCPTLCVVVKGAAGPWEDGGLVCVHKGDGEGAGGCASGQRAVILTLTPFQNVFH